MVNVEQGSDFDIGVFCRVKDQARIEIHEMRVKTQEGWRVICFRLYCVEQSRKAVQVSLRFMAFRHVLGR